MKKIFSFMLLIMLTLGLLVGCGSDSADSENETGSTDESTEQTDAEESAFPLTVTDALDNELTIDEKPKRIVSLIPSNTEIAFALGLGEEIVGVSDNDNYPEEVEEKEKVGGMELNVEAIIGLEPDLVLAHASGAHNSEAALQQIRDAGINVFVVHDAQDIESVYGSIEQVAQVTGTQEKAEEIVGNMKEEFAALSEKTEAISDDERQSVFFEVAPAPEIFTAGKNTFFQDLLEVVNADNAAHEQDGWVQIDPEAIVELNPDVIITTYGHYADNPVEQVTNRDGWGDMTAVENEQVYDVHSDLVSRPGPRLVEGAKEIAEVVYPELFEE
ncbi:ABC transporter substrate-binding protein [Lentibacillus amyloliquefaciens]|uniref:Iron ABC transporter substrate-binding protein n=1 Tax=Lentibacillus amyloliquefaciens TaxID=1472767 RepID=A0A0U4F716_9BACI|nr:ABC transporter substrate-binding protein [Lentibacillus amyloliquefaciens]ALX48563.1 iron ABC transporter substrate-binding protein [Lentibacillus amyloliquefaciens]